MAVIGFMLMVGLGVWVVAWGVIIICCCQAFYGMWTSETALGLVIVVVGLAIVVLSWNYKPFILIMG